MPMRAASLTARVKRPAWLLGTDLPGGTTNWTCGAGRSVAVTGLPRMMRGAEERVAPAMTEPLWVQLVQGSARGGALAHGSGAARARSEEHTSELQSLMRISSAVFCLKKKTHQLDNMYKTHEK